jgi:hypothetical protein
MAFQMINRINIGWFGSYLQVAITMIALIMNIIFEYFHSARLGVFLVVSLFLHMLRYSRFVVYREGIIYITFVGYMFVSILWTENVELATNTLDPALNCILIYILFSAFVAFHDLNAVLLGGLSGFLIGAIFYTLSQGFPFVEPEVFSYNSIAGIYFIGLYLILLYGWHKGSKVLVTALSFIVILHIVATASIKFNLGIPTAALVTSIVYHRQFLAIFRKYITVFIVLVGIFIFAANFSESINDKIQKGLIRIELGYNVIKIGGDLPGYGGADERIDWAQKGIEGWLKYPLLGNGVEAFRNDIGITSHSGPIDLLYNSGLFGFSLFYAIFISMFFRLYKTRNLVPKSLSMLIFAALIYYVFIQFTAPLHSYSFFAVFISLSAALITKQCNKQSLLKNPQSCLPMK